MAESSTVVSGEDATPDQYNDLRKDVLDPAVGHPHDGSAAGGKKLQGDAALNANSVGLNELKAEVTDQLMNLRTRPVATGAWPELGLATILNLTSSKGVLNGIVCIGASGVLLSNQNFILDITADGVLVRSIAFTPPAGTRIMSLSQALRMHKQQNVVDLSNENIGHMGSVNIYWTSSLLIQANKLSATGSDFFEIAYAENV